MRATSSTPSSIGSRASWTSISTPLSSDSRRASEARPSLTSIIALTPAPRERAPRLQQRQRPALAIDQRLADVDRHAVLLALEQDQPGARAAEPSRDAEQVSGLRAVPAHELGLGRPRVRSP